MIESVKELEKLLKLCRKQGVIKIKFDNVEFELGDVPRGTIDANDVEIIDPYKGFPTGELTPEQLMFYSSGGLPENDPTLKTEAS